MKAECCGCSFCAVGPASTWVDARTGAWVEALTTTTRPPFTFAYNLLDKDMLHARHWLQVEPRLTRFWADAAAECCREPGGVVIDVGGNFGWYTLLGLSLGCRAVTFEPVAAYRRVLRLAASLNPGFASRLTLHPNVVYPSPGNYTLTVPLAGPARGGGGGDRHNLRTHRRTMLGMASMAGGKDVRRVAGSDVFTYEETVPSVRIDDVVRLDGPAAGRVCMLKADVEGFEPHAMATARRLLSVREVGAVQIEVSRLDAQYCANIRMLRDLLLLGYEISLVPHLHLDYKAPESSLRAAQRLPLSRLACCHRAPPPRDGEFDRAVRRATNLAARLYNSRQLQGFSTNLVGTRRGALGFELPDLPLSGVSCAQRFVHSQQCCAGHASTQ